MSATTEPRPLSREDIERIEKALDDVDAVRVGSIHNLNLLCWIGEVYGRRLVAEIRRLMALRHAVYSLQSACEHQRCPECRSTQMDRDVAAAIITLLEAAK